MKKGEKEEVHSKNDKAATADISPYLLDRNLEDLVSVIRLADLPNYGEEEESYREEKEGRET